MPIAVANYDSYLHENASWGAALTAEMGPMGTALDGGDDAGAASHARNIVAETQAFVVWLDQNPPSPCYKAAWDLAHAAATDTVDAFTFENTGLTNGVAADVTSATALMDRANGEFTQAKGLIDPAACN